MEQSRRHNPVDKVSVYIAAGLVSGCGALMFNVMPVFVGALSKSLGYGEARLGDMVAFFNIGFTLSAVSAAFWVRAFDWRRVSLFGAGLAACSLFLMGFADGFALLSILIGVSGVAMGSLYALILAVLGDSSNPDRAFGVKLGLETLPGALLLFLLPVLVVPAYGFAGVAVAMALVILGLGLSSFFLPGSGVKGDMAEGDRSRSFAGGASADGPFSGRSVLLPCLGLLSSLLFFTGIAATWAFLELVASEKALPSDQVGTILAVAFIICGLGGFAAAALGDRWGPRLPMIGIIALNLAGLWCLGQFDTAAGYALGACLFLFSVNFTLTYTFGLTAEVDSRGTLVVLSAAGLSLGAIIGPAISGRLVEALGFGLMLVFSALCALAALGLYLFLDHLRQQQQHKSATLS